MKRDDILRMCPDGLFAWLVNIKGNARITREWVVERDGIRLITPTPKFIGFGMSMSENKLEHCFKIKPGYTCVYVGASIGDTTIPMAAKAGDKGKVYSVEPHPTNIRYLKDNLGQYRNTEIMEVAAWNRRGSIRFNEHPAPTGHSIETDTSRPTSIKVKADTLDNLFLNKGVDYIKVDVQGSEAEVLKGATKLLQEVNHWVIECHGVNDGDKNGTFPDVFRVVGGLFPHVEFVRETSCVYCWRD